MTNASAVSVPAHAGAKLLTRPADGSHIVQFYEDDEFLFEVVADFLEAGLIAGEPLVVVATEAHRQGFIAHLESKGFDVDRICRSGRLHLLDARTTLGQIMVNDRPDRRRFRDVIGALLESVKPAAAPAQSRVYGEMVDLLWQDGNTEAAARLEEHWNEIIDVHSFSLLCAYRLDNFPKDEHGQPFRQICGCHSHVLPTESYAAGQDPNAQLLQIALLQQRARALETEIAHRRRAEAALLDALQVRDDFLAIAGHELRTPLTAVQLYMASITMQAAKQEVDPQIQDRLQKASQQVARLGGLVEQLLDVSRISSGALQLKRTAFDLSLLVLEVAALHADTAARERCDLQVVADQPVQGEWDRTRIEQVVVNLLTNAIKYGRGAPVELRVMPAADRAQIIVRDHGIGIAAESHAHVFEKFERVTREHGGGGLGLGLWIASRVVEAHGGTIRLTSALGEGAEFVVDLPR